MTLPILRVNAGIYSLAFEEEKITIQIDRIHDQSDRVSAEIYIKTSLPGVSPHLHQARLNLTSTRERHALAKFLNERLDLDWDSIVEEACVMVLTAHRQGEPVVELHDAPKREGPRYRVEPLLLDGHPNLLYGDGAVGKSVFALFLGVLVSSGYHACGLNPMPGNVLYLDYETSGEEMRERVELIEAGLNEPSCAHIEYRFCVQPIADDIAEVQRVVVEREIDLVIVDSMGVALGGEKGDPRVPTVEYFRALRSLRCCTLTIDHVAKQDGASRSPYGSIYKRNLARQMFEMRKQQETGENVLKVGLYHRKANFGAIMHPLGYQLTFAGDALYIAQADVRDVPELAEGMGLKERIVAVLRGGLLTTKEIGDELSLPQSTVRTILNRHKGQSFVQTGSGKEPTWGLFTEEEA